MREGKRRRKMSKKAECTLLLLVFGLCVSCGYREKGRQTPVCIMQGNGILRKETEKNLEIREIAAVWREISDKAEEPDPEDCLQSLQQIVAKLGEKGYIAVDSENQVNMTGADRVERFCKEAEAGKAAEERTEAEITVLSVDFPNSLTIYDMSVGDGGVDIARNFYQWKDGELAHKSAVNYRADLWKYTAEGYLFFAGDYCLESRYAMELCGGREYAALRVQPLDERCREMNRKYIFPLGYGRNNLFLCDWSGEEPGSLDFQDLFERLYPMVYGRPIPYTPSDNLGSSVAYRIPEEEFEQVIGKYIQINRKTLREKAVCFPEDGTYAYRPRGFYETETPEIPFPEVVDVLEQPDGTVVLTVYAVYREECTSRAFAHQVTLCPQGEGEFRFVSNRMLSSAEDSEMWWHTERLTKEEQEALYGNMVCSRLHTSSCDRIDRAIFAAFPPLASSSPWMFTAKKSVRPGPVA